MWQMQKFLAKVTLKYSYYVFHLLLKVRLSWRSLTKFFLLGFFVLSLSFPQPQPQSIRSRTTMLIKWGSNLSCILVLSGDCLFTFGDHFFFDFEHCSIQIVGSFLQSMFIFSTLPLNRNRNCVLSKSNDKWKRQLDLVLDELWAITCSILKWRSRWQALNVESFLWLSVEYYVVT